MRFSEDLGWKAPRLCDLRLMLHYDQSHMVSELTCLQMTITSKQLEVMAVLQQPFVSHLQNSCGLWYHLPHFRDWFLFKKKK